MDNPKSDLWAISSDGEHYGPCDFESKADAIAEGEAYYDGEAFYVGRIAAPTQPEEFWNAEDWLDHVSGQDDYGGDWAEGWCDHATEHIEELEREVRAVMAAWLDRYNLRPNFFIIEDQEHITPDDCRCIDCGGDQPGHSSNCAYMREIAGVDEP